MNNPWETQSCYGHACAYCDAQSRLDRVKDMTEPELRAALLWPDTQKSVRLAIERRLRKMWAAGRPSPRLGAGGAA